jgi:hypothetical protein
MARKRRLPEGLSEESLDALIDGIQTPEQLEDLFRDLKKALIERVLRAEHSDGHTIRVSANLG